LLDESYRVGGVYEAVSGERCRESP